VRVILFTLDAEVFGQVRDGVVVAKDGPVAVLLSAIRGPGHRESVVHTARAFRVLVVEDDDTTRQALVDFLSDEGFLVESAFDGQQALGVASSGAIDVIVLDLSLPVLDGAAFADIWRKHPGSERVPIVAMSGLPRGEALAAGVRAAAFRDKPLDLPAFANLLRTTAILSDP